VSVRRPQHDCSLCVASLTEDHARAIFHAHQESKTADDAVARLAKGGIETSTEQLRAHIQYHRPVQPAPRTRLKPEEALQRAKSLPERQRRMLLLISRVPALSGTQLAELFYWNGEDAHMNSARSACYRDLAALVKGNFLYRLYPQVAAGPAGSRVRAWQHRLSFYFLGRDAVPFVAGQEGFELQRGKDWFATEDELPNEHEVFAQNAAAEVVASFARQSRLPGITDKRLASSALGDAQVEFDESNWWGNGRLDLPARGTRSQPVGGLSTFALHFPEKNLRFAAPFLYEYDDGLRPLNEVAEQLLRFVDLKRSGAVGARFPALAKARVFPPLLVVTLDPYRLEGLRRAVQKLAQRRGKTSDLPIIVCCDVASACKVGVSSAPHESPWISLWDGSSAPRQYRLVDVLARQSKELQALPPQQALGIVFGSTMPELRIEETRTASDEEAAD
jgi:hypothetical protein